MGNRNRISVTQDNPPLGIFVLHVSLDPIAIGTEDLIFPLHLRIFQHPLIIRAFARTRGTVSMLISIASSMVNLKGTNVGEAAMCTLVSKDSYQLSASDSSGVSGFVSLMVETQALNAPAGLAFGVVSTGAGSATVEFGKGLCYEAFGAGLHKGIHGTILTSFPQA